MSVYGASRLANVDPRLVQLVTDVGTTRNVQVVEGARTVEQEQADIAKGNSALMDPTHSKHVIVPGVRDLAEAVDLAPWPVNWMDLAAFKDLGAFVKARAQVLGVAVTWGGDWISLHDYDHWELNT